MPEDAEVAATAADLLARGVPGLIVNSSGGLTGAGATVDIHGRSSVTGSNAAAIYLDGIRIDERAGVLPGNPGTQALQVLDMIPASEVKAKATAWFTGRPARSHPEVRVRVGASGRLPHLPRSVGCWVSPPSGILRVAEAWAIGA